MTLRDSPDPLADLLSEGVDSGVFPGAVAAVGNARETERLVSTGQRDPEQDLPTTVETLFDCASLTKPIVTTTVALRLVEAGRIALTDTLAHHVPALEGTDRGEIELVELLTHTAGFQPYEYDPSWTTLAETISGLYDRSLLDAPPGERHEYSCLSYVHLAEALRGATGESLADLAESYVFEPAGMDGARLGPTDASAIAATYDHDYREATLRGEIHDPLGYATDGESGNAGLFATVRDVARFARTMVNDGAIDGRRVLSPATVARLSNDHVPDLDEPHSLGWRLARGQYPGLPWSAEAIGHTGYTGTSLWIDPEYDRFAVLLTNQVYDGKETGLIRFRERFYGLVGAGRY